MAERVGEGQGFDSCTSEGTALSPPSTPLSLSLLDSYDILSNLSISFTLSHIIFPFL